MLAIIAACVICPMAFVISWQVGLVSAAIFLVIVLLPIEFDKTKELKTVNLVKLRRDITSEQCYYVQKRRNKCIYALDNRGKYKLDGLAYEEQYVRGRIKIYESDECKVPLMKVFQTKPRRDITLAPFSTRTEYVFYVPIGAVMSNNGAEKGHVHNVV